MKNTTKRIMGSPTRKPVRLSAIAVSHFEKLMELLTELGVLQDQLLTATVEKLAAMRRCDSEAILAASQQEGNITTQVSILEKKRKLVFGELCAALGMNRPGRPQPTSLRELVPHLDENNGGRLQRITDILREKMLKVAEANRVAELVTQEMMKHFKELFAALLGTDSGIPTYSCAGTRQSESGPRMLDAVG